MYEFDKITRNDLERRWSFLRSDGVRVGDFVEDGSEIGGFEGEKDRHLSLFAEHRSLDISQLIFQIAFQAFFKIVRKQDEETSDAVGKQLFDDGGVELL